MKIAVTEEARPRVTAPLWATERVQLLSGGASPHEFEWLLSLDHDRLALSRPGEPGHPLSVDFSAGALGWRRERVHQERLVRACGLTRVGAPGEVVDATAGLARDAVLLAAAGARVILLERHPLLHALLNDALERADDDTSARMQLFHADGADWLLSRSERRELIYLDPMFPSMNRRAALKKEQQWLQLLLDQPSVEEERRLLDAALQSARRVVVKRPAGADPLDRRAPHHSLDGKTVRFDVYE